MKTFTVPFALGKIKENITITSNTPSKPSKEQIINQAFKFHSEGNISEAAKHYQYFISQGFKDHRVFCNYGIILNFQGKPEEAEISLRKAIELESNFAQAHSNLGTILKDLGKSQEAELSYRKAIELKPDYAEAHLNLGNILGDLGKSQEAELSYRKAIEFKPDFAQAHYNLGNILGDLGKSQEAELSYRKAIEFKPDFAQAHYNLGNKLRVNERLEEAEISFKEAIKIKFGFVQAYNALASIQEELGRKQEAEESSHKVLHLKSTNNSNIESQRKEQNKLLKKPSEIEYPTLYRPGMGTENVGAFLKSMVMMLRPNRVLEIGAGYTTPFLLEALINNERVFDDGNLKESYFHNYVYNPKLIIIDNQSLGELTAVEGMEEIVNSEYTNFIEGNFEGKGEELFKKHGHFDFVWFDCGGPKEYISFIKEYWDYCSKYLFFHFTYSDGEPNINHKIIRDLIKGNPITLDIVEPHKKRQGSITIVQKQI